MWKRGFVFDQKLSKVSKRVVDKSLGSEFITRPYHSTTTMTKKNDESYPSSSASISNELLSSSLDTRDCCGIGPSTIMTATSGESYLNSDTRSEIQTSSSYDNVFINDDSSLDDISLKSREELDLDGFKQFYLAKERPKEELDNSYFEAARMAKKGSKVSPKTCPSQSPSPKLSKLRKQIREGKVGKVKRVKKTTEDTLLTSQTAPLVDYELNSSSSSSSSLSDSKEESSSRNCTDWRFAKPFFVPKELITSSPIPSMRRLCSDPENESLSSSTKLNINSFASPVNCYRSPQSLMRKNVAASTADTSPGYIDVSPKTELSYSRRFNRRPFPIIPSYDIEDFTSVEDCRYIDTHCHLDFLFKRLEFKGTYKHFRDLYKDTYPKAYEGCIAIFCDPQTFGKTHVWENLLKEDKVWGAFGCHPHMAREYDKIVEGHLLRALDNKSVVALGEIGLDYSSRNNCDRDKQKFAFKRQLSIAVERKLPLVIHSRDSSFDTLEILKEVVPKDYLIHRHCFTGDWVEASRWLGEFSNLYIGLTALVTFQTAKEVHDVARNIPLDRLLLETDAPYFLPRNVPREQRWSHPGMAIHVAAQIAALRIDATLEDILQATRKNTKNIYGI